MENIESTGDKYLGERIASSRIAKGYSEQHLAERLGVQTSSIEHWESGEREPRANRVNQLSGILNVPLTWLMAGNDTPVDVDTPVFMETRLIEEKVEQASQLLNQLDSILTEIRVHTRRVQQDIDSDNA